MNRGKGKFFPEPEGTSLHRGEDRPAPTVRIGAPAAGPGEFDNCIGDPFPGFRTADVAFASVLEDLHGTARRGVREKTFEERHGLRGFAVVVLVNDIADGIRGVNDDEMRLEIVNDAAEGRPLRIRRAAEEPELVVGKEEVLGELLQGRLIDRLKPVPNPLEIFEGRREGVLFLKIEDPRLWQDFAQEGRTGCKRDGIAIGKEGFAYACAGDQEGDRRAMDQIGNDPIGDKRRTINVLGDVEAGDFQRGSSRGVVWGRRAKSVNRNRDLIEGFGGHNWWGY